MKATFWFSFEELYPNPITQKKSAWLHCNNTKKIIKNREVKTMKKTWKISHRIHSSVRFVVVFFNKRLRDFKRTQMANNLWDNKVNKKREKSAARKQRKKVGSDKYVLFLLLLQNNSALILFSCGGAQGQVVVGWPIIFRIP